MLESDPRNVKVAQWRPNGYAYASSQLVIFCAVCCSRITTMASLLYNFYYKSSQSSIELSSLFQTVIVHSICLAGNLCSVSGAICFKSFLFYLANLTNRQLNISFFYKAISSTDYCAIGVV